MRLFLFSTDTRTAADVIAISVRVNEMTSVRPVNRTRAIFHNIETEPTETRV